MIIVEKRFAHMLHPHWSRPCSIQLGDLTFGTKNVKPDNRTLRISDIIFHRQR